VRRAGGRGEEGKMKFRLALNGAKKNSLEVAVTPLKGGRG